MGPEAGGLRDAVFEIATRANDHLITARKMLGEVGEEGRGKGVFATYLPAVAVSAYLERLEKADFNAFEPGLMRREWRLPWRVYRAAGKKEF